MTVKGEGKMPYGLTNEYHPEFVTILAFDEEITYISETAFSGWDSLTELKLPASIETIEYDAFSACAGLTSINWDECSNLTTIKDYVFNGCSGLTSLTLPANVTYIGDGAFGSCYALDSVIISATNVSIAASAFSECYDGEGGLTIVDLSACTGLTTLDLSACTGLTTIGAFAFMGCTGLESVILPDSIETIESGAFSGYDALTNAEVLLTNDVFIDGTVVLAGNKINIAESLRDWKELVICQTLDASSTTLKGVYYVSENLTLNGDITLDGEVTVIVKDGATLTVGSLTGEDGSSFNYYGAGTLTATGDITADTFNFYGGKLTANDITAGQMYITWANATDSIEIADGKEIKVEDGEGNKIILGKDFCSGKFTVQNKSDGAYSATYNNFNSNKLYALSGCLVTVPASMVIEGDNARRTADGTVAYDCAAGSVTLKPAEGHYFKGNDGKLSTDGKSYNVKDNGLRKIELTATEYNTPPTIEGCTFTVDENGNGYYETSSAEGFKGLKKYTGSTGGLTFKLTADVALPDGYTINFYGTLDGGGHLLTFRHRLQRPQYKFRRPRHGQRHALLPRRDDPHRCDETLHAPHARHQCHCHDDCHRDQDV